MDIQPRLSKHCLIVGGMTADALASLVSFGRDSELQLRKNIVEHAVKFAFHLRRRQRWATICLLMTYWQRSSKLYFCCRHSLSELRESMIHTAKSLVSAISRSIPVSTIQNLLSTLCLDFYRDPESIPLFTKCLEIGNSEHTTVLIQLISATV